MNAILEKTQREERFPAGLPLENGLHLDREAFERRYELMPLNTRAELIEGIVYMGSPVSNWHSEKTSWITGCLFPYAAELPAVKVGNNATVRLDARNEVQPDVLLRLEEAAGGQSRAEANYISGAPELITEIALSSLAYDMHEKLQLYHRHGVREYLVWQGEDERVTCFRWREAGFEEAAIPDGVFQSQAFPGLRLDLAALLKGDLRKAAAEIRAGLASPEFAAFAARLNSVSKK